MNNGKNRPHDNINDTTPAAVQNQTRRRSASVKGDPGDRDNERATAHNATTSTTMPAYSPEPENRRAGLPSGPTPPQYSPPPGVSSRYPNRPGTTSRSVSTLGRLQPVM